MMVSCTVAPSSAVPVMVGVPSSVTEPSAGEPITGAPGAVASTVKVIVAETPETLPRESAATALTVCAPSARTAEV